MTVVKSAVRAERLWQAYVEAAKQAQASLRFEDGIAAGRAWAAFMEAFESMNCHRADERPDGLHSIGEIVDDLMKKIDAIQRGEK